MRIFFSFILISLAHSAKAHEYHFAFAEAKYNTETKTVQTTITFSTRDFEHALAHEGFEVKALENYLDDKMMQYSLSEKVLSHFSMVLGEKICSFNYVGFEVLNTGLTNFYFESQELDFSPSVEVTFDLLMNDNPKQQNKLTFIYLNQKKSVEFLSNSTQNAFKLETVKE